jgi:hypothetical protein
LKKGNDISTKSVISKLIESCRDEQDIDKKIETLYRINSILPKSQKLKIPSLLTDDYVETALYNIEQAQIM